MIPIKKQDKAICGLFAPPKHTIINCVLERHLNRLKTAVVASHHLLRVARHGRLECADLKKDVTKLRQANICLLHALKETEEYCTGLQMKVSKFI